MMIARDDDSDDDFTDDEEFHAPIDTVDPFILFTDIMKGKIWSFMTCG